MSVDVLLAIEAPLALGAHFCRIHEFEAMHRVQVSTRSYRRRELHSHEPVS